VSSVRRLAGAEGIRRVLFAALIVVGALLALAWWGQERIAYQPPRVAEPVPAGAERVEYRADDLQELFALVVDPHTVKRDAPTRVLLAFHGNADLAVWLVPWASEVARRTGAVVIVPEYRGYGGLAGPATAAGIRLDARAAAAFAHAHFPSVTRFDYYGHSLGSAVATELAVEQAPAALVLESPFTSARAMAELFGTRLLRWIWPSISRIPYDTEQRVRELDVPVFVAHGDRDMVIPVRMGRAVFAAARRPGALLIVPGGTHNDLSDRGGAAYWDWLERALR
jgi:fermentation-respiration switch protein FrsA (DUF1100 family)